jgi:hypothetical protein
MDRLTSVCLAFHLHTGIDIPWLAECMWPYCLPCIAPANGVARSPLCNSQSAEQLTVGPGIKLLHSQYPGAVQPQAVWHASVGASVQLLCTAVPQSTCVAPAQVISKPHCAKCFSPSVGRTYTYTHPPGRVYLGLQVHRCVLLPYCEGKPLELYLPGARSTHLAGCILDSQWPGAMQATLCLPQPPTVDSR